MPKKLTGQITNDRSLELLSTALDLLLQELTVHQEPVVRIVERLKGKATRPILERAARELSSRGLVVRRFYSQIQGTQVLGREEWRLSERGLRLKEQNIKINY